MRRQFLHFRVLIRVSFPPLEGVCDVMIVDFAIQIYCATEGISDSPVWDVLIVDGVDLFDDEHQTPPQRGPTKATDSSWLILLYHHPTCLEPPISLCDIISVPFFEFCNYKNHDHQLCTGSSQHGLATHQCHEGGLDFVTRTG